MIRPGASTRGAIRSPAPQRREPGLSGRDRGGDRARLPCDECRWPWARNAASCARTQSATGATSVAQRDRGHRQLAAALGGLADHPLDVGADVRREVGLVDRQQVGAGDARAALARDVVAAGDVDHEDLHVGERGGEDRGQVVAAALDEDDVERPGRRLELLDRLEVRGDVVADRGVRAAAGLDRGDPLDRQHAGGAQELGVLGRVDVVGHDAEPRPRPTARRRARRSGCSCRSRRGRRRRSGVRVQLAKRRSLCSRWMGAASSIATAAGRGQRAVVGGDRARARARSAAPARRASARSRPGRAASSFSAARGDRRGVVVEREQRACPRRTTPAAAATTPSAIGRGVAATPGTRDRRGQTARRRRAAAASRAAAPRSRSTGLGHRAAHSASSRERASSAGRRRRCGSARPRPRSARRPRRPGAGGRAMNAGHVGQPVADRLLEARASGRTTPDGKRESASSSGERVHQNSE